LIDKVLYLMFGK